MEEQSEPDGEVIVAQATRTGFDIGLEMKDGVAELGVTGTRHFTELLCDGIPLAEHEAGEGGLVELLVERKLSSEKAAIEGRDGEFEIVGIEAANFLDG